MNFQAVQRQLTDFIRQPDKYAGPEGIEPRRLAIYRDLFYNNIEGFLSGGFPVLREIFSDEAWHAMARDFVATHQCQSPYFLDIAEEFLAYLQVERGERAGDPPFLRELAHYEWVEMVLDVAEEEIDALAVDPSGDLLAGVPVISPLAWPLAYRYPVHRIGPSYQPASAPAEPTYLVVSRGRDDRIGFMETNAVTHHLLELIQSNQAQTGVELLDALATRIQHPQPLQLRAFGGELLGQLRDADIIAGSALA